MIKKAMILAAGFGKRILPLTSKTPKPLLKIDNEETLLSNTIKFLIKFGIEEVIINAHHLSKKISDYINQGNFNINIKIVIEKEKILDTGGGVLNVIKYFSNEPFLIINPDTLWNSNYINELELMQKFFFKDLKNKCSLLLVDKNRSFDKSFKGDFDLKNNLISRSGKNDLRYIYTGLQIIKPEAFNDFDLKAFSINLVWDKLITLNEISGFESKNNFLHVSNFNIYKKLLENIKH
tara:strand:- start:7037 stop:7744 length:708 start_codon:yes stop_codon:yes gene_type:complete